MRNRHIRLAVLAALSSASALAAVNASAGEIVFDGTLAGTRAGALRPVNGTYNIGQNRGQLSGTNLFHSFDVFNLDAGETAVFSGNAAITNIISRVTGGIPTTIDGTIRSTINGANFWFVNPAGLTVGPTGVIDVSGAVALGAADYVAFANGEKFFALPDGDEVGVSLSVSSPVDFGFLPGSFAGELVIQSADFLSRTSLAPANRQIQPLDGNPNGNTYSRLLSGGAGVLLETEGNLELHGARIRTGSDDFFSGNIEVHAGGSINMSHSDLLTNAAVDGFGGDIFIQGGELVTISHSSVVAQSVDANASTGNITLSGSGVLINDYSQIALDFRSLSGGAPDVGLGTISIATTGTSDEVAPQTNLSTATAGVVRIVDSAVTARNAGSRTGQDEFDTIFNINIGGAPLDADDGEDDTVHGASHVVIAGSTIATDAAADGFATNVSIAADDGVWIIDSNNGSSVLSATASDTALSAGSVFITAGQSGVTIDHALIDTSNSAPGSDDNLTFPGIDVAAQGQVLVRNSQLRADADNGFGAGTIRLDGGTLHIQNSSLSASATVRDPSRPTILNNIAGDIFLSAGARDDEGDFLTAGDPLDVAALSIENSTLRTNSDNNGSPSGNPLGADAGHIDVFVSGLGRLAVSNSTFESAATGVNSGAAGLLRFTGGSIDVANSTLNVSSESLNPAVVDAGDSEARAIEFDAVAGLKISNSTLTANTSGLSMGGDVFAIANSIDIQGSNIQASTTSTGAAGNIILLAFGFSEDDLDFPDDLDDPSDDPPPLPNLGPSFLRITDSTLATSTGSTPSSAGSIELEADGAIDVTRSSLNVSVTATPGTTRPATDPSNPGSDPREDINQFSAASIDLFAGLNPITITDSTLQANTTGIVDGGSIDLTGGSFVVFNSSITASSSAPNPDGAVFDPVFNQPANPRGSAGAITIGIDVDGIFEQLGDDEEPPDSVGSFVFESSTISTNAAATNGGDIEIAGFNSNFTLTNSKILASAGVGGFGGDISIDSMNQLSLQNSQIQAVAATGQGGSIQIFSGAANIQNSSIATNATAADGGDIFLDTAGEALLLRDSSIVASAGGTGIGGDITLDSLGAGSVLQNSQIQALANNGSGGTIGVRLVPASAGALQLLDAQIATNATAADGGDISIDAGGAQLSLTRSSIVASAGGTGVGGDISILNANGATLTSSQVQALADAGSGGTINIGLGGTASGSVLLNNSSIRTNALNSSGGNITLDAAGKDVTLRNSTIIASAGGSGVGGGISIMHAGATTLSGSQVQALANAGAGGTISFALAPGQSGSLVLDNSAITTNASNANGGNITVDAAGHRIVMRGSSIVASAGGTGTGGDIAVHNAGGAILQNVQIQALANAGAGGTISIDVADGAGPIVIQRSNITTNAVAAGGGNITFDAGGNQLLLSDSKILASAGAAGTGGNILIDNLGRTIMQRSQILARADAGNGGTITINLITGALFLRDAQSTISADSNSGNDGLVDINSPDTDLNPAVKPQDASLADAPELSANVCRPASDAARSTFVRDSRGGVSASPDNYLVSIPANAAGETSAANVVPRPADAGYVQLATVATCRESER